MGIPPQAARRQRGRPRAPDRATPTRPRRSRARRPAPTARSRMPCPCPCRARSAAALAPPLRPRLPLARPSRRRARAPCPLPVIAAEADDAAPSARSPTTRTNVVFSRGNPEAKLVLRRRGARRRRGRAGAAVRRSRRAAPRQDDRRDGPRPREGRLRLQHHQVPSAGQPQAGARSRSRRASRTCTSSSRRSIRRSIVALGNTAVAALLGTKLGITKVRGQWKLYRGKIPVMPTYHPSYLLRPSAQQVEAKKQAWEDLQAVMKELGLPRDAEARR